MRRASRRGLCLRRYLERLAHHFFALLPEGLSRLGIERICAHSLTYNADRHVVRDDITDMAVFAISASDFVSRSHNCSPHRSGGALRNGLPLEGHLVRCRELLIH